MLLYYTISMRVCLLHFHHFIGTSAAIFKQTAKLIMLHAFS